MVLDAFFLRQAWDCSQRMAGRYPFLCRPQPHPLHQSPLLFWSLVLPSADSVQCTIHPPPFARLHLQTHHRDPNPPHWQVYCTQHMDYPQSPPPNWRGQLAVRRTQDPSVVASTKTAPVTRTKSATLRRTSIPRWPALTRSSSRRAAAWSMYTEKPP